MQQFMILSYSTKHSRDKTCVVFMVFFELHMFFWRFSDASYTAARDKEVFDATVNVFHEYPQGGLTAKVLSRECI